MDKPREAARSQVFEPFASKIREDVSGSTSERKTRFLPLRLNSNLGMTIVSLLLLIVGLSYQSGGGEAYGSVSDTALTVLRWDSGHPLADDEFIPTRFATATAEPLPQATIATGTRFVETPQIGTSTRIATDVGRAETTPVPLLTGLTRNRPSIWGSKGFYVLLGLIYVTLLGLFIEQIISIAGGGHEQR